MDNILINLTIFILVLIFLKSLLNKLTYEARKKQSFLKEYTEILNNPDNKVKRSI